MLSKRTTEQSWMSATTRVTCLTVACASATIAFVGTSYSDETQPTKQYSPGEVGNVVRLGEEIVTKTADHPLSKPYVGNSLNCTSCHLDSGRHQNAGSFLGTAAAYPAWSPREERVITLEDRVLNCFMRSQNGIRPPNGSRVSVAIATYITWLSKGSRMSRSHSARIIHRS